jgi:transcriptional regulator with XRE-family HTH domain
MKISDEFPAALKFFREKAKLTQGDCQRNHGILRTYVSKVENGHVTPSIDKLEKFCTAYGITVSGLIKAIEKKQSRAVAKAAREEAAA